MYHLVCACRILPPTIYLNARHNQLVRMMNQEPTGSDKIEMNPPPVASNDEMEIWWDEHVKTTTKAKSSRPDTIIWRSYKQLCQIVEITVPLNTTLRNVCKKKQEE